MRLVQVAVRATDLDRAEEFYARLLGAEAPPSLVYLGVDDVHEALDRLGGEVEVETEPYVIFTHEDDTLGPAGTSEWQAFVRDPLGHTVGLVSFEPA